MNASIFEKRSFWLKMCAVVLVAALVVGGFFLYTILTDPYDCRILEGVTIAGVDVGDMTKSHARKTLATELDASLYKTVLSVQLPGETLQLSPADTDVRINVRKAVNAAFAVGRDTSTENKEIDLLPYLSLKEAALKDILTNYAALHDTAYTETTYRIEGQQPNLSLAAGQTSQSGQTLVITKGLPDAHLNIESAFHQVLQAYAQSISLCKDGQYTTMIPVTPTAIPQEPDWDAIIAECCITPVNDTLDMENYQVIPGSYGYGFDRKEAEKLLQQADYGEMLSIPLTLIQPEITGEAVYFQDVLGTCETKHNDNENRNTNLRLVCETLDGYILQPGEEFSYNGVVGERTPERGFKPAPAYSGDRLIQDYGGGVCQGSTTLYNCVLLADLEVIFRVCHGARVNYVPVGLDAAVNWATQTDLKFKNNFHFPMMIRAKLEDGYMKMQILGTDEKDYYIEMTSGVSESDYGYHANSYKNKYSKETGELISKDLEARSVYYKSLG